MHISWIIPTYNEEERIEKTLFEVDSYLKSKNFQGGYEIIVVDSSSLDNTQGIVKKIKEQISSVKLESVINKGKGWGVKQGMLSAMGEMRVFADADNSVSPDHLDIFLPFICGMHDTRLDCFDIVIGSIEIQGASIEENAQWYRRVLGKFSKYVIRFISGLWEIRDTQRGFKLFSKDAAEFIFSRQAINGWGFDIEILLIAKKNGFKIKEVPVKWINPAGSKVTLKSYLTTMGELLQIKWNSIRGLYT